MRGGNGDSFTRLSSTRLSSPRSESSSRVAFADVPNATPRTAREIANEEADEEEEPVMTFWGAVCA